MCAHQVMRVTRLPIVLLTIVLLAGLMAPANPAQAQGVIAGAARHGYNVNVRSGPGSGYHVIGRLYGGQPVSFAGRNADNQWLQLHAEGVPQWVNIAYMDIYGDINALPITNNTVGSNPVLVGEIGNAFVVNVRVGPGVAYASVGRVQQTDMVTLVARSANSAWVQLDNGGWINASYVTALNGFIGGLPVSDAPPPSAYGITTNIANAYVLNVRSGPGPNFLAVRRVTLGDQVTLVARNADGSWVKLASAPDQSHWINSYYTTVSGSGAIMELPVVAYTSNPAPGPIVSSTSSSSSTATGGPRTHVVQTGENLFRIALSYGLTVDQVAAANGIANPNFVYVGQTLVIP